MKEDRNGGRKEREIESKRDFGRSTVRTTNAKDNSEPSNQSFIKNNMCFHFYRFHFIGINGEEVMAMRSVASRRLYVFLWTVLPCRRHRLR